MIPNMIILVKKEKQCQQKNSKHVSKIIYQSQGYSYIDSYELQIEYY